MCPVGLRHNPVCKSVFAYYCRCRDVSEPIGCVSQVSDSAHDAPDVGVAPCPVKCALINGGGDGGSGACDDCVVSCYALGEIWSHLNACVCLI